MKTSVGVLLVLILSVSASTRLISLASPNPGSTGEVSSEGGSLTRETDLSTAAFSLDGVELQLSTRFLHPLEVSASDPSSAMQVAAAVEREPVYKEFSITAVPFDTEPPTESLPRADWYSEEVYRAALREYRHEQGGHPTVGSTLELFGRSVAGLTSVVEVPLGRGGLTRLVITEWVARAGPRVWIVRASYEVPPGAGAGLQAAELTELLLNTSLSSDCLEQPSTSLTALEYPVSTSGGVADGMIAASSVGSELPFPPWWEGECDTEYFYSQTGEEAYPLGAEYRGLKACGPRPWADGGPQAMVDFGAGMKQIEWQCPELSKRFLYLAYDIAPYRANGSEVVWNYSGDLLEKVPNCQVGRAPQPNDVLSYGSTSTWGHTSVVVASDVDSDGNGTIWVIEQNSSPTGLTSLALEDWCVDPGWTDVSGWLHEPVWAYYTDDEFVDRCGASHYSETYVFGNWGEGGPGDGCPAEYFGARFSREVYFPGGHYTFTLSYEGRARLMIDGETIIDAWESPDQVHETSHHTEGGYHRMTIEYYHDGGDAYVTAFWRGPGFELAREERENPGWYAQYWGNPTLSGDPAVMVNEGAGFLDHDWGQGGPARNLPVDRFASRFERSVDFDEGLWRFVVSADDGVRFWIGDVLVVDEWQDQVATFREEYELDEGEHELRLEHYENLGLAHVRLSWEWVDITTTLTGHITSPVYAAVIDNCPLTITAVITDLSKVGDGIERVEFHAAYDDDWHHVGGTETPPYQWTWDCSSVRNQGIWLSLHAWQNKDYKVVDLGGHVYIRLNVPRYGHLPLVVKAR